ncbi:LAMI_0H08636g1_1 [Lachancea mirantina]|uniref:LAMI_0H08636g1_1 n=1 Tax=Lachancea mirantina TaxID=1230905 RepID=A0A1G4KFY6_9SACH|nr:LAMI_0H08636g1_1 [Lachancea mirantina]
MASSSWKQWLRLSRRQLKQFRETLNEEIDELLGQRLPNYRQSLVRVPVPVRNGAKETFKRNTGRRNYHNVSQRGFRSEFAGKDVFPGQKTGVNTAFQGKSISLGFADVQRRPKGVPRGLFTNWNMNTARFTQGRCYSTASIRITHDAVQNMSVGLRCFFNMWDDSLMNPENAKHTDFLGYRMHQKDRLASINVSTAHAVEVYDMIKTHRQMVPGLADDEQLGCFVEFKFPTLHDESMPAFIFACDGSLSRWNQEISRFELQLREIENCVRCIHQNFGALPVAFDSNSVKVHFPNLSTRELELFLRDLGITRGVIKTDSEVPPANPMQNEYVRYETDVSILSDSETESDFTVLSDI